MGFSNENNGGGNGRYANFKDGKIITKIDGEKKTFTTVSGDIVDIDILDATYQGRDYRKVVLYLKHKDGITQLGFPLVSGYGWSFFQLCGNIDPKLPVSISGGVKDIPNSGGKRYGSMFIKQGGSNLKHLMKKNSDAARKIPPVTETKVGKQTVKNYEKRDEFMEKVITKFYDRIKKVYPDGVPAETKITPKPEDMTEPIDDLPF